MYICHSFVFRMTGDDIHLIIGNSKIKSSQLLEFQYNCTVCTRTDYSFARYCEMLLDYTVNITQRTVLLPALPTSFLILFTVIGMPTVTQVVSGLWLHCSRGCVASIWTYLLHRPSRYVLLAGWVPEKINCTHCFSLHKCR